MATEKKTQRQKDLDAKDLRRRQGHPLNDNLGARQPRAQPKPKKK